MKSRIHILMSITVFWISITSCPVLAVTMNTTEKPEQLHIAKTTSTPDEQDADSASKQNIEPGEVKPAPLPRPICPGHEGYYEFLELGAGEDGRGKSPCLLPSARLEPAEDRVDIQS